MMSKSLVGVLLLWSIHLAGQSPISTITTGTETPVNSTYTATAPSDAGNLIAQGADYRVNNGTGSNVKITAYTISGTSYQNFVLPDTLAIRRTDGGRFVNIWYTLNQIDNGSAPTRLALDAEKVGDADALYLSGNINAGYDNILVNSDDQGNGTIQAQIERVDVIWYNGIVTCAPANAVFPVIERGGNDEIRIAAITALDINGDPSAYSSQVLIEDADWPQTGVSNDNYLILRRHTVGQEPLPLINIGLLASQPAQTVQGVAVSFQELGISAGQIVYGYSLFASDTDGSNQSIDLTDINTFPTNTLASASGIDLVAGVSAAVSSDNCLVEAVGPGGYKSALSSWLKANDGALTASGGSTPADGANLGFWEDQAVGNHDFTPLNTAPTYRASTSTINFNPTADFVDNANRGLETTSNTDFDNQTGNTGFTNKGINLVFRVNATDANTRQQLYEQGGSDSGIGAYIESGSIFVSAWQRTNQGTGSPWNDAANANFVSGTVTAGDEYILTLEQEGSSATSGNLRVYLNGRQLGTLSSVGLLFNDTDGIGLGAVNGASRYANGTTNASSFDGEIPEFIYCNEPAAFSLVQRQKIESYLAVKYGITLDQSSPTDYYNAAGAVIFDATNPTALSGFASYNSNIAGIGRDDASELTQLKSKSEVSGALLQMEKSSGFSADNTWLIWGQDGASTNTQNTDVPGVVSERLNRSWRVAKTGNTGTVDISFDISGLGLSTDPDDFSLLIAGSSSGGSFFNASITTGASLNGNEVTFTGVILADAEFLTLGTGRLACGPGGISSNLSFWLKADAGTNTTTQGAEVTSWLDQDGPNNMSGSTGTSPTYQLSGMNFNPVLTFDGTDDHLAATAGLYSDAYFIVASPDNTLTRTSNEEVLVGFNTTTAGAADNIGGFYIGTLFGASDIVGQAIGVQNAPAWVKVTQTASDEFEANRAYVLNARENIGGTDTELGRDGQSIANANFGSILSLVNQNFDVGRFSANTFSLTSHFDGNMAEVFSYSVRPSDIQIQQIESYLAIKYGITLDQSTATDYLNSQGDAIWKNSGSSVHIHDIAGIIRDDLSCLEQKQSKSQNSDAIVTIGLGTIATTNAGNTESFASDGLSLTWSNDDGFTDQTNANTTDVPSTVLERMTRVWATNETGDVGPVTVQFDLTGLGYGSTLSDYRLIVSGSTTMANGILYPPGALNGNILTFENIDFSNDDYFTLGTQAEICGPGGVTTDLALWLRADEGTNTVVNGSAVTSWADQGVFQRNAITATLGGASPVQPTFETEAINFNPAIRFYDVNSTNNTYLSTSNGNTVQDGFTMFTVYQTGQTDGTAGSMTNSPAIIGADASGDLDFGLGLQGGRPYLNAANDNVFTAQSAAQYVANEPHILSGLRVVSGAAALFIDSALDGAGTSDANSLSTPTAFGIGNHPLATNQAQFDGFVAEAIVFSSVLNFDSRNRIESYLALKYGITRAGVDEGSTTSVDERDYRMANGTSVWDYDAQGATYHHDIAGIGNDELGCFSQLKSKSINSDARVTMSVPSFSSNEVFLVWGNDDAPLEGSTTEYNEAQVQSRLVREWQVQKTGNPGTVSLTFDLNGVSGPTGLNTNNLSQTRLMIDADGDFTTGASIFAPTTVNGNEVTFMIDFDQSTGYFFTLGSEQDIALPIVLIDFDAQTTDRGVSLNWATAEEGYSGHFTVQRSTDAREAEDLLYIAARGEALGADYQIYDDIPLSGISYYRLKMTDEQGEHSYSEWVRVEVEADESWLLYPNPTERAGELIRLKVPEGIHSLELTVYNQQGQKVNSVAYKEEERELSFTAPEARGLYLVMIKTADGLIQKKLWVK